MSRMPLFAVVIYIATRLALDGEAVDASLVPLFARAGLHLAARDLACEDEALISKLMADNLPTPSARRRLLPQGCTEEMFTAMDAADEEARAHVEACVEEHRSSRAYVRSR